MPSFDYHSTKACMKITITPLYTEVTLITLITSLLPIEAHVNEEIQTLIMLDHIENKQSTHDHSDSL